MPLNPTNHPSFSHTHIHLYIYILSSQFWCIKAKQLLSVFMSVFHMTFQTSHWLACRRVVWWISWHDQSSFFLLPQYFEIQEMFFVKVLDGFVAFFPPNLINWRNLLECMNRYTQSYKIDFFLGGVVCLYFRYGCPTFFFYHETGYKWRSLEFCSLSFRWYV